MRDGEANLLSGACPYFVVDGVNMNKVRLIIGILIVFLSLNTSACHEKSSLTQIKDKILFAEGHERLDAIREVDKLHFQEEELITLYMELLDHYIGEGPGEIVSEKITTMGDRIMPFLIEKKNSALKGFSYKDTKERNVKIESCINAIKDGEILYAVFPENLEKEIEPNMKILRIFLEDFKKNKKRLPKDLKVLREFAWQQYGYKLRILNPWGQPLKYSLKGGNNYVLEAGEKDSFD
jgi:hypothetical protein